MKTLFFALALLATLVRVDAAQFRLDGKLSWEITEPRLTFGLEGNMVNLTPGTSGTIKLVLWATTAPYPAPGQPIGEITLGQIQGGYQFSDFSLRTTSNIPNVTGTFHFTITVLEYTTAGWRARLVVPLGTAILDKGDFLTQQKWKLSTKKVIDPPTALAAGKTVSLKAKSTGLLNLFPVASQEKTKLAIKSSTKLAAGKISAKYSYKVVKANYSKSRVKVGEMKVEYPATSKSGKVRETILLFFQSENSGTYQSIRTEGALTETTWGGFSL